MPHLRSRHALASLKSKLKYAPVVAIQGVRQCGKSTLARDLLPHTGPELAYRTFDRPSVLDSALLRPESFLEGLSEYQTVILDEAQKAPRIFDAIKAKVDEDRRPGQFLLLGSTEFSKGMKIRETLTGRLSRLRLYPLLVSESLGLPLGSVSPFFLHSKNRISRKDLLRHLDRGGMPGVFSTRQPAEWQGQIQDWVALTVERDAQQIPGQRVNSALLMRVLREVAVHPEPEASRVAKSLRMSSVTVKALLEALKTLFVVHEIQPHPSGTGKPRYYLCDPGICGWLGGSFEKQLETWFYLEMLGKISYAGLDGRVSFTYFRSTKGSVVHGVWEDGKKTGLLKLLPTEGIDERELLILESTAARLGDTKELWALSGQTSSEKVGSVRVLPWESLG